MPVFIVVACLLSLYALHLMISAKRAVLALRPHAAAACASYAGLAEETLGAFGGVFAELVNATACFGIASAYLVFIASTLATVLPLPEVALIWALVPLLAALACVREMGHVSVIAIAGDVAVALGVLFTSIFCARLLASQGPQPVPLAAPAADFPTWFGSVAFLFFVHFALPAVESSMAQPGAMLGAAAAAFSLSAAVAVAFGLLGALALGVSANSVVITELGTGALPTAVKLAVCLDLLLTFPVICRSAFLVLESLLERCTGLAGKGPEGRLSLLQQCGVRTLFVVLAAVTASLVESFGAMLALVGGVSLTTMTLVLPPLMALMADDGNGRAIVPLAAWEQAAAMALVLLGCGVVAFSAVSLNGNIKDVPFPYENPGGPNSTGINCDLPVNFNNSICWMLQFKGGNGTGTPGLNCGLQVNWNNSLCWDTKQWQLTDTESNSDSASAAAGTPGGAPAWKAPASGGSAVKKAAPSSSPAASPYVWKAPAVAAGPAAAATPYVWKAPAVAASPAAATASPYVWHPTPTAAGPAAAATPYVYHAPAVTTTPVAAVGPASAVSYATFTPAGGLSYGDAGSGVPDGVEAQPARRRRRGRRLGGVENVDTREESAAPASALPISGGRRRRTGADSD